MDAIENIVVDPQKQPSIHNEESAADSAQDPHAMDQMFNQIQEEMRRPDITQEAVAAAFEAIQRMGHAGDPEPVAQISVAGSNCPACGTQNAAGNKFCGTCGGSLAEALTVPPTPAGQHHYHHHYHHHFFAGAQTPTAINAVRPVGKAVLPQKDANRPALASGMSRAESAVRKMAPDWAQACNTKHLDDLVELYAADAMVLRPNVPPVRGTAAIREFFFGVLEAGLGEVEMESQRVELFGDIAFEAGRCKMLVPVAMGKRREERGKYLVLYTRQSSGEWKLIADCWSSDLSLAAESNKSGVQPPSSLSRKGA